MKVIKRDGKVVIFDKEKIRNAILGAFSEVDGDVLQYSKDKAREIANYIESLDKDLSVEDIQDIVEQKLMASNRKDVARAYVRYRYDREKIRQRNSSLIRQIAEKITASNVQNQNANVDEKSFGGRMGEANSVMMKKYALDYCMSDMAKNNHLNNEVYTHDLDHYAIGNHNCLSIPFDKLLANGFKTRQVDIRPANSINTAMQLVAVIFQLQSLMQFGGVSATHLDWTMVPYVRKSFYKHYLDGIEYIGKALEPNIIDWNLHTIDDEMSIDEYSDDGIFEKIHKYALDMTEKEIKQSVEALFHNLNSLQSRSGNQLNTKWLAA